MTVFMLPAFPGPSQEDWSIENDDRSGGTSIVGTEQVVSSGSGRWAAKLTFMVYGAEVLGFRAPLLGLRGRFNGLLIGPRNLVGQPSGVAGDDWAVQMGLADATARGAAYATAPAVAAALAADAALGATSVEIAMPPNRAPLAGQYLGLGGVALHVITAVNGRACAIQPALRADASAGDAVEFTRPACLMRARSKLAGLPVQARGSPLQRWRRDDWVIPCTLRDASGTPISLAGSVVGAELWLAGYRVFQPLTAANGGIVRVSDAGGQFTVIAPRTLTAQAPGDAAAVNPGDRTRVLIYLIDSYGRRQTLGVVPFAVFDGSEDLSIDEVPQVTLVSQSTTLQIVVAVSQGLPGPSNITAAQITDGGAIGRQVLQAPDAAGLRALLSLPGIGYHPVQDADYGALSTDTFVDYRSLTAPRTVTLPFADAYPPGVALFVNDGTPNGACSPDTPIIVAASGNDTIAGQPSVRMASGYLKLAFHCNGTKLWTV